MGTEAVASDFRALQRWSAVGLYGLLVPLMVLVEVAYGSAAANPLALTAGTTLLVAQMAVCAIWGDGMPEWAWGLLVAGIPGALLCYSLSNVRGAASLLPMLVVTVGWTAVFLTRRLVVLAVCSSIVVASLIAVVGGRMPQMLVPLVVMSVVLVLVGVTVHLLVVSLKGARIRAEERANTDALTGAKSRAFVLGELQERLAAGREGTGLMLFDLDHFKRVNDTYGHVAGDHVLEQTATRIRDVIRDRDVLGRLGGEEFLILFSEVSDEQTLMNIAEKVRHAVGGRPVFVDEVEITATISAGALLVEEGYRSLREVLLLLDDGLYAAKGAGRNRVRLAGPGRTDWRRDIAAEPLRIEESLPVSLEAPARARHAVVQLRHRMSPDLYDRTVLVVSELVANGVISSDRDGSIDLVTEWRDGRVVVEVTSPTAALEAPTILDPRGMRLVEQLSESIGTTTTDRTSVRCSLSEIDERDVVAMPA
jgi:diguanylate cyclase (GGDEF)-like protein